MQPWIVVEGAGEDSTVLRTDTTVQMVNDSALRSLTLELDPALSSPGVEIQESDVRLEEVTVRATSFPAEAIRIHGTGPDLIRPELSHVTVALEGGTGVHVESAAPTLSHLTIVFENILSGMVVGLHNHNASPTVDDLIVQASSSTGGNLTGIRNLSDSSPRMERVRVTLALTNPGTGGSATGIDNQASSPALSHAGILVSGGDDVQLTGMRNGTGSAPILVDIGIDVEHTGSSCAANRHIGLENDSSSPRVSQLRIQAASGSCQEVYGIWNLASELQLRDGEVLVETQWGGSSAPFGLYSEDSTVEVAGLLLQATNSMSGGGIGIETEGSSTLRVEQSIIGGDQWSIRDTSGGTAQHLIASTKLLGPVDGSNFECLWVYSEDGAGHLQPLSGNCY
jgi:hypothetical protein